jgi:hypothetical protein
MKKTGKSKKEPIPKEPEYIVLDERARVFAGLREGYPYYSEDLDEAKPLKGQTKFSTLQRSTFLKLEQMFIEDGGEKRRNRKTKLSI